MWERSRSKCESLQTLWYYLYNITQNNVSNDDKSAFSNNHNSVFIFENEKKNHNSGRYIIIAFISGIIFGIFVGVFASGILHKIRNNVQEPQNNKQESAVDKDSLDKDEGVNSAVKSNSEKTENTKIINVPEGAVLTYPFIEDSLFDNYIPGGTYKCGTDIESGKYVIFPLVSIAYYAISTDVAKNDILEEGYTLGASIELKENTYIEMYNDSILVPESSVDNENLKQYGIFKVGEDIEPGEYKVKTLNNTYQTSAGSYSGLTGAFEIKDNPFDESLLGAITFIQGEQEYIDLQEGQYLILENAAVFPA